MPASDGSREACAARPRSFPKAVPDPSDNSNVSQNASAMRATLVVSACRLTNAGLALVLGMLSATYFGTSVAKDCYLVAQTIPNLISTLLMGGVYGNLLVSLAAVGRREGISGQRRFARRTLWQLTLWLTPCILVVLAGAGFLTSLIAPPWK